MRRALSYLFILSVSVFAQTGLTPPGEVIGVGNFIHIVADVDKSLAFYHDVLGMDLQGQPPAGPRPYLVTPEIVKLYNATGGQYRVGATLVDKSPMRAELVEWKDVDRKPVQPRIQDPGASMMILTVRNFTPILQRVKQAGAKIITAGGEPVTVADVDAIVLRDPDGFYVTLRKATTESDLPPEKNVIEVSFGFTVSDTDAMVHVFGDALGFQPQNGAFNSDPALQKLFALPKAQVRRTTMLVPGTAFPIELLEFKGVDRKPVHSRPQDPGSPVFRLRVANMDSVLKALAATGVKVASEGGQPVTLVNPNGSQRAAITSAPDNLFVQVLQAMPAAPQAVTPAPSVNIGGPITASVRLVSGQPANTPPQSAHLLANDELAARPQTAGAKGDQLRHYFFKDAAREVPYRLFVPSNFEAAKELPLLVALHGAGGNQDTLMDWGNGAIKRLAETHGFIVATPLGYPLGSSYGQHYDIGIPDSARAGNGMSDDGRKRADQLSEQDVLRVMDLVAQEYNVDRGRIFLMGHSRGALATWYLGEKYRERWAGLAMVAGGFLNPDYPYENLRKIPVMIAQGGADTAALPERARAQAAAMEKIGLHPRYFEVPEATHGSIVDAALPGIFEFFDAHMSGSGK